MSLSYKFVAFPVLITCFLLMLSACKDEELPKSQIDFDHVPYNGGQHVVTESSGEMSSFHPSLYPDGVGVQYEVKLILDRPVAETTVLRFSAIGTATRGTLTEFGDYALEPEGNMLTINKGEQSASFMFTVFEDYELDYSEYVNQLYLVEGVTITLEEVVSGTGVIGKNKTFTLLILEDDPIIYLSWDPLDDLGFDPGDVDMDLILWYNGEQVASSASTGIEFEGLYFPAGLEDGQIGMSYTYYSGTSNNLEFYVDVLNPGGKLNGTDNIKSFVGIYTTSNINKYDESGMTPHITQTMDKKGLNYLNLTELMINTQGSRVAQGDPLAKGQDQLLIKKIDARMLNKLFKADHKK